MGKSLQVRHAEFTGERCHAGAEKSNDSKGAPKRLPERSLAYRSGCAQGGVVHGALAWIVWKERTMRLNTGLAFRLWKCRLSLRLSRR